MNQPGENEILVNPVGSTSPDPWAKNPEYTSSTAISPTVASSTASFPASTTTYPEHSDFYTPQPGQMSEAEEIRRKKEEEEQKKKGSGAAVGGAAAVAGIAGLVLMGPITAVAAAGGAAYVAATNKGVAGSAVRASGTAATAVGRSARNFDKRHQITSKSARGIASGVGWISGRMQQRQERRRKSSNPQAAAADLTN